MTLFCIIGLLLSVVVFGKNKNKIAVKKKKNTFYAQKSLDLVLSDFNSFICRDGSGAKVANDHKEYYSPDLYTYEYNSHGYRSIEFTPDIDILTAGCSHTFGIALPFEYTWSQQLQKMLPNKKIATLAWSGWSSQQIISYLFRYFKEIGNPKMVICNLPDFHRFLMIEKEGNYIFPVYQGLKDHPNIDKRIKKNLLKGLPPGAWGYFINIEYILMLEQYCQSNNIKLIWSSWNLASVKNEKNRDIVLSAGFNGISDMLQKTFQCYYDDTQNSDFEKLAQSFYFDKNIIKYSNNAPHKLLECHLTEKNKLQDVFDLAYDRYDIPPEDWGNLEKHKLMSREEKEKNLSKTHGYLAHDGAHRHIHWAEFYYKIIKERYPDFTI